MLDIRKYKGLLGLTLAVVLLSFIYVAPNNAKLGFGMAMAWNLTEADGASYGVGDIHAIVLSSAESRIPENPARIFPVQESMEEFVNREQNAASVQLARFLAVAIIIIFVAHVTFRTIIRRYGYHMIDLWENIVYIHEVDGKKGERFSVYIVS